MKNTTANNQGFTLVEILVSILIMTIGIFATLSMITTAMNANKISNRLTTKTALAQQVMEELVSKKINDLDPNDSMTKTTATTVYDLNGSASGTDITVAGGGTYHATYSTAIDTPLSGTTQITVNVTSVPDDGNAFQIKSYRRIN